VLSPDWNANAFEAVWPGPPKRKLYLWQEQPATEGASQAIDSGWGFAVCEFDAQGDEQPLWDTWEATFAEILRHPPAYAPPQIDWRRSDSGEVVDLNGLRASA
jgi:hypothetical protein